MEQDQKDFFLDNDLTEMTSTVKLMKAKKIPIGQSSAPKMSEEKTLNINLPLQMKQKDEDLLKNSAASSNPKP